MTLPTPPATAQPSLTSPAPPLFASVTQRGVTTGGLVGTTLSVWWRNAFKFAGLTLLAFVPVFAVGFAAALVIPAMASRGGATPDGTGLVWWSFVPITILVLTMIVQMGGLTYGTVQYLAQRPVRFGAMLAAGFQRALPLVGAGVLMYLAVMAGMLLLIVPGIVVACGLAVAIPAVVIERIGPIQALRRSWALTRDRRLTIFVAWLVLWVVLFGANVVMQVGTALLGPFAAFLLLPVQLFLMSLPVLLPGVAYHDLRAEKEGTATEELARVFE
jgi:hypothetical protein